jgi:hypothetical protein
MPGVTSSELLWLALAVIAAGLFTGVLAGLFGEGGGAVIVPALYEVFRILDVPAEVRMQLCIGTSLAIIVPTRRFVPTLRTAPWGRSFPTLCGCGRRRLFWGLSLGRWWRLGLREASSKLPL